MLNQLLMESRIGTPTSNKKQQTSITMEVMKVKEELQKVGIRVKVDDRQEKIGYKIREAQLSKTPYMLIVGDKEKESNSVGVRSRKEGDIGAQKLEDFILKIKEEVKTYVK